MARWVSLIVVYSGHALCLCRYARHRVSLPAPSLGIYAEVERTQVHLRQPRVTVRAMPSRSDNADRRRE